MFLASKNHTHFIADLGAMAAGIGFIRWMRRPRTQRRVARKPKRGFRVIDGGGGQEGGQEGGEDGGEDHPKWLN